MASFREQLKKQNWLGYFIELLIVILGLTIAFALNRWNENSNRLEMEKELLRNLYTENTENLKELQLMDTLWDVQLEKTKYLSDLLKEKELKYDSINKTIIDIFRISSPDLQYSNLENTLINPLLQRPDLKAQLLKLKASYDELKTIDEYHTKSKHTKIFAYLVTVVDLYTGDIVDWKKIESLEFRNNIRYLLWEEIQKIDQLKPCIEQLKKVQSDIEAILQ